MEDFKWKEKENYTNEDIKALLEQHKNVVYKQVKQEYEPKLKEYEIKVNEYQEKELFNGFNEKQIKIAKSLINTEYKNLNKDEALNKIKTDYQEIFNSNSIKKAEEAPKAEIKKTVFNPKGLVDLHELADKSNIANIREKAKTHGLTDKKELEQLIRATFSEIK